MAFDLNLNAQLRPAPSQVPVNPLENSSFFNATVHVADTLIVPAGTMIEGDFQAHSVCIKGAVKGKVVATAGPLVIERSGVVYGQVHGAGDVVIAGKVSGPANMPVTVQVSGCLYLASTARVKGYLRYAEVRIYRGAVVEGALCGLA
jgi:cytoskeletal protein CcmA (bactofilin family)